MFGAVSVQTFTRKIHFLSIKLKKTLIGHFQVALNLIMKARLSVKGFSLLTLVFIHM